MFDMWKKFTWEQWKMVCIFCDFHHSSSKWPLVRYEQSWISLSFMVNLILRHNESHGDEWKTLKCTCTLLCKPAFSGGQLAMTLRKTCEKLSSASRRAMFSSFFQLRQNNSDNSLQNYYFSWPLVAWRSFEPLFTSKFSIRLFSHLI